MAREQIDLTEQVKGTLPVANGGIGQTSLTSLTLTTPVFSGTATGTYTLGGTPTITSPTVNGYTETVNVLGTVTSTKTIPALSGGTVMTATLTAATACTFTMPTAVPGQSFILAVTQASTPTGTATFTGVVWPAGGAPVITATANAVDVLTFFCTTGTTWRGSYVQGYAS